MTVELKAFGMHFEIEESVLETSFTLLEQLRIQGASPTECMNRLANELKITGAAATAIYAEYAKRNKPLF